jgi:uncharacterized membrane protein (DUF485 family)
MNWQAIDADPRFQRLHREKRLLLSILMAVSIGYYFMLPLGAAWFPELFRVQILGPVNAGLLFALSEFLMAWGVAFLYARHAGRRFDALAAELVAEFNASGEKP